MRHARIFAFRPRQKSGRRGRDQTRVLGLSSTGEIVTARRTRRHRYQHLRSDDANGGSWCSREYALSHRLYHYSLDLLYPVGDFHKICLAGLRSVYISRCLRLLQDNSCFCQIFLCVCVSPYQFHPSVCIFFHLLLNPCLRVFTGQRRS